MEKITSFMIDHTRLYPGVYVSRKDKVGEETVTPFDLRFTKPNVEPAMENAAMHTIEHLAATFLRNDKEWKERVLYFGPMGCRTGFYDCGNFRDMNLPVAKWWAKKYCEEVLRKFSFENTNYPA